MSGGVLYWNANEALLFVAESNEGARMSYARYMLEPLVVGLGHVLQPSNKRCTRFLVIRVTDKDTQHYDTDLYRFAEEPYCGFQTAIFEGRIYSGYLAQDKLWRWSGTEFDPATPEEVRAFDAAKVALTTASRPHPWEFDNVDGWSMRGFGQTPPKYQLVLNGQPVTLVFHGETWPPAPLSVDLIRPGQPPQTIWTFDGRPHRVSKSVYQHVFEQR
jgi:hypothetical protein